VDRTLFFSSGFSTRLTALSGPGARVISVGRESESGENSQSCNEYAQINGDKKTP
jgi:hypothetical protein